MLSYFKGSRIKELLRTAHTRLLVASPLHHYWLRRMTCVFATNEDTLTLARRLGAPDTCLSLDTGMWDESFAESPRSFEPQVGPVRLLWTGRMLPRKALALSLDGLQEANRLRTVATLTVLGGGLAPETFLSMIAERGLQGAVQWSGSRVPWVEVQKAYRTHDAFLFTSLRDSFGSQHLEAMANGLPVITLDHHGAKAFVPDKAGFKVRVSDRQGTIHAIAQAIQRLAEASIEDRNRMSRAGWQAAQTFAWSKRALRAERLYEKVLGSRVVSGFPPVRSNVGRAATGHPIFEPI
jgi:glycosyltransferase involved in cell wall biosynthesis